MASSTVLFTGANGSIAMAAIEYLLKNYPTHHAVLAVRNATSSDPNTQKLRFITAPFNDRVTIRALDLSDISAVGEFSATLAADIASGSIPPLTSIICSASCWNLVSAPVFTRDGFEPTFQVNYLAHVYLIQQLLESFGPVDRSTPPTGRIVLFVSDVIFPGRVHAQKYPPHLPEKMEDLAKPNLKLDKGSYLNHGYKRYALSKLATVTWMYAMNAFLQMPDSKRHGINVIAINPGHITDSRSIFTNTPLTLRLASRIWNGPLKNLLQYLNPEMRMRTCTAAGKDVIELAVDERFKKARGYFYLLEKKNGPPDSLNGKKQAAIWIATAKWLPK